MTERKVISIVEFCSRYGMSTGFWQSLKRNNDLPDTIRLGRRVLIPIEAVEKWEKTKGF